MLKKQAKTLFRLICMREKHSFDWKDKLKSVDCKPAEQSQIKVPIYFILYFLIFIDLTNTAYVL
jgi:hypothetical protein